MALATIGFMSWTGLVFLFKFTWGAIVDNIPLPVLANLGRRRSWLLVTQSTAWLSVWPGWPSPVLNTSTTWRWRR